MWSRNYKNGQNRRLRLKPTLLCHQTASILSSFQCVVFVQSSSVWTRILVELWACHVISHPKIYPINLRQVDPSGCLVLNLESNVKLIDHVSSWVTCNSSRERRTLKCGVELDRGDAAPPQTPPPPSWTPPEGRMPSLISTLLLQGCSRRINWLLNGSVAYAVAGAAASFDLSSVMLCSVIVVRPKLCSVSKHSSIHHCQRKEIYDSHLSHV